MTDLLPCPFCGGTSLNYESRNAIECADCTGSICLDLSLDITAEVADRTVAAAWNRRPATETPMSADGALGRQDKRSAQVHDEAYTESSTLEPLLTPLVSLVEET